LAVAGEEAEECPLELELAEFDVLILGQEAQIILD
jgi:hypothetical protein